jgi:outer membrane protein assembly factor BamE (lipoprotein component of BamABCDE complex)
MIKQASGVKHAIGKACLVICILALAACSPIMRNHGYVPTDDDLALIEVGRDNRDTVGLAIGRPSAGGLLNDQGWYFVQSKFRHFGPYEPQEIERQVVAISFSENGIVENIERFGLAEGRVVPLSRRVTTANVKGINVLRQLFSNFGRFRAGDFIR